MQGDILIYSISGIGEPYSVFQEKEPDVLTVLPVPAAVEYHSLEGKHITGEGKRGMLLAVSEKKAVMETREEVAVYENVKLEVGDGLYAKITWKNEERITLEFTAKPSCFDEWKSRICNVKGGDS